VDDIEANDFRGSGGSAFISIKGSDAGFQTDDDCGAWTRTGNILPTPNTLSVEPQARDAIERNYERHQMRNGGRLR
jgi:hypothetical protein